MFYGGTCRSWTPRKDLQCPTERLVSLTLSIHVLAVHFNLRLVVYPDGLSLASTFNIPLAYDSEFYKEKRVRNWKAGSHLDHWYEFISHLFYFGIIRCPFDLMKCVAQHVWVVTGTLVFHDCWIFPGL